MKNKIIAKAAMLMLASLSMLTGTAMSASAAENKNCTHDYVEKTYEATCTDDGYNEYTCLFCGDKYKDHYVSAKGHNFKSVKVSPDCTHKGYVSYFCLDCGYSYMDNYVDELGHVFSEVKIKPSCVEDGYIKHTCSVCGFIYRDNYIPKLGHDYKAVRTEVTCTTDGYTTYTCSRCENEYVGNEVKTKGHSYTETVVKATCNSYGYTTYCCSVCDDRYVDDYVKPIGHKYLDVVVPADKDKIGYTRHICYICNDSYISDYVTSGDDSYLIKAPVKESHQHSYGTYVKHNADERNLVVMQACECGSAVVGKISVTLTDVNGLSTTITPNEYGIVDYSGLNGTYTVVVSDEKGNSLKELTMDFVGGTNNNGEQETPDIPNIPDIPDVPDFPIGEHTHNFFFSTLENREEKKVVIGYRCECGENNLYGLCAVSFDESGNATVLEANELGELDVSGLAEGNYQFYVYGVNGEEVGSFVYNTNTINSDTPEQNSNNNLYIGLGIAAVVIAVGGIATFIIINKKKNKK